MREGWGKTEAAGSGVGVVHEMTWGKDKGKMTVDGVEDDEDY